MSRPSSYAPALLSAMRAVLREPTEDPREISVTQLIDSPKVRQLYRQHHGSTESKPDDQLWAFFGTTGHSVLEKAELPDGCTREMRMRVPHLGWTITGVCDLLDQDGIMWDYKFTSVYATKDGLKPAWIAQLNLYRWLAERDGLTINGLRQGIVYRDWTEREQRKCLGWYPPMTEVREVEMWDVTKLSSYVEGRLLAHTLSETKLADCTPDETWNGRRCARYCHVNPYCEQYQRSKEGSNG